MASARLGLVKLAIDSCLACGVELCMMFGRFSAHNCTLILLEILEFVNVKWQCCRCICLIQRRLHPLMLVAAILIVKVHLKYRTLAELHEVAPVIGHVERLRCIVKLILRMRRAEIEARFMHVAIESFLLLQLLLQLLLV